MQIRPGITASLCFNKFAGPTINQLSMGFCMLSDILRPRTHFFSVDKNDAVSEKLEELNNKTFQKLDAQELRGFLN